MKMYFLNLFVTVFSILAIYPNRVNGLICKGCLELDEFTFDKVIAKFSTVLIKFDIAFPYGKKHDEYAKFAKEISESSIGDIIVSVVGIKNYGETTNSDLAERFNIEKHLPEIKLFSNNNANEWIDFPKSIYFDIKIFQSISIG